VDLVLAPLPAASSVGGQHPIDDQLQDRCPGHRHHLRRRVASRVTALDAIVDQTYGPVGAGLYRFSARRCSSRSSKS